MTVLSCPLIVALRFNPSVFHIIICPSAEAVIVCLPSSDMHTDHIQSLWPYIVDISLPVRTLHTRIVLSADTEISLSLSGATAIPLTHLLCPVRIRCSLPSRIFQTRIVVSVEPDITNLESGVISMQFTHPECPASTMHCVFVCTSHILIVPSADAVAMIDPSKENFIDHIALLWHML